ncbi:MAG: FG-GAP-like repeat-containing protein [Patescibacteria group bacterium]
MIKKTKFFISIITIFSLLGPFSFIGLNVGQAAGYTTNVVAGISEITVSPSSTVLGATTSYLFSFKINADMTVGSGQLGGFNMSTFFNGVSDANHAINFTSASLGYIKDDGASVGTTLIINQNQNFISPYFSDAQTIASGSTVTILINNVINPLAAGTYGVDINAQVCGPDCGGAGQGQNNSAILIGIDKFIEGYVTYDTGGAVSTCAINANLQGAQEWSNTNCGSDGYFRLALTTAGLWQLHPDAQWVDGQRVTTDWFWQSQDPMIDVSAAGTYTQNFTVVKADATVTGKLVKPDGGIIADPWQYYVDLRNETGQGSGSGLQSDGSFSIPAKAGTYTLQLNSQGSTYYIPSMQVTVVTGETKALGTIYLKEKAARIKGVVTNTSGVAVGSIRVNAWISGSGGSGWSNATTAADGSYSIPVFKGEWEVAIDQWDASQKNYITQGGQTRVSILTDTQVTTGVNFSLTLADAQVTIVLKDAAGNLISNMYGWAYCRKKGTQPGPGSDFGMGIQGSSASIKLLGGYTYVCAANVPPESNMSLDKEVEVAVAVGENKTVNVTLIQNDGEIVGYLRDASTGAVITNVQGDVYANGEGQGFGYNARINADGSYRISVKHGTYFLGYNIRTPGFMQGNPDQSPVTVPVNGRAVKTLKAHRANAYIAATVLDPNGNKVKDGWVWCNNMKQKEREVKGPVEGGSVLNTGGQIRDGSAMIGVVAGTYSCGAGLPPEMSSFLPPQNVDVSVAANITTPITLKFRASEGSVTGSATREDGTALRMGFCHAWNPQGGFSGGQVMDGSYNIPLTRGTWYIGCDSMDGTSFYRSNEEPITLSTVGTIISKNFTLRKSAFNIPQGISSTFDASQLTTITLPDNSIITIPANAIASSGNYTLTASPNINIYRTPEAKPALGFAWSLELTDSNGQSVTSSFNSSVTITIFYDDAMLKAEGIEETSIIGRYWDSNSSTWKLPDNVVQNTEQNTIMMTVNHFTDFAITTGSSRYGSNTVKNIVTAPKVGGGPQVTVWDSNGTQQASFMAYNSNLRTGVKAVMGDLDGDGNDEIVTLPGALAAPHLRVFNSSGQNLANTFVFARTFRGTYSLALGDVDGDGNAEIIVTPTSNGGPQVRIYKYANGSLSLYSSFFAFATTLRAGVEVTVGDVNGDGADEIVAVPGQGAAPHVRIFNGTGGLVSQFFAFPTGFRGGVNIALGDYNGDGAKDLALTPASAGGPQYRVVTYTGSALLSGFAYNRAWRMGLKAGIGDVDGDNQAELVVSPVRGGAHIQVYGPNGLERQFFAFATSFRGGADIAVADLDADGTSEIIVTPMSAGGPQVRIMNSSGQAAHQFMALHPGFRGGVDMTISK